jgi:hypothetical protein
MNYLKLSYEEFESKMKSILSNEDVSKFNTLR